jgi:NADH-quinone oxidoreductase subunit N
MWTPDVYQGAPTSVTALMASGTKVAAFAAFLRVFVGGFGGLVLDWRPVLWVLAVLTMLVGAVLGVVQTDLKRLLAYSSIAHAGYILIGVVAASRAGIGASLYYLLAYALTVIGAFAVVARLERAEHKSEARLSISGGFVSLGDLAGLGARQPVLAGLLTLFLLSLAGIPPTSGFVSKFTVFSAAVDSGQTGLVVIGVATSVVAAFYYLKVIVMMFMQPGPDQASPRPTAAGLAAVLGITAAATVFLGVLPGWVLEAARSAARFLG